MAQVVREARFHRSCWRRIRFATEARVSGTGGSCMERRSGEPRGGVELPDEWIPSFCCAEEGCRKRLTPESLRRTCCGAAGFIAGAALRDAGVRRRLT